MNCRQCSQPIDATVKTCPACGCPQSVAQLLASSAQDQVNSLRADLERMKSESMLTRNDVEEKVTHDLAALALAPPSPDEIAQVLENSSLMRWQDDLDQFLATHGGGGMALEGVSLHELLD